MTKTGTFNDLTPCTAAKVAKVSTNTVKKWCKTGNLPYYTIPLSTHMRIKPKDLNQFLYDNGLINHITPERSELAKQPKPDEDGITRVKVAVLTIGDTTYLDHDGKLWSPSKKMLR